MKKPIIFIIYLLLFLIPSYLPVPVVSGPAEENQTTDENIIVGDPRLYRGEHGEKIYLKEKRIEMDGIISNPTWPLELLACAEGGKDYESLVVIKCSPKTVHLALVLFGLKDGTGPVFFGDMTKPAGDLVLVQIEWEQSASGGVQQKSYRAEDLILDARTNQPMERTGWAFSGSEFQDETDPDTGQPTGRKFYAANSTKTLIATYHDPSAILDNPALAGGLRNIYFPNKELLPPKGTKVKITIRAPDEKELKEMIKTNQEVDKREQEMLRKETPDSEPQPQNDKLPDEKKQYK